MRPGPRRSARQEFDMRLRGARTRKRAVVAEHLELTGGMRPFDAEIWYGDRIGVLGSNGSGSRERAEEIPSVDPKWYCRLVNTTYVAPMGDRGRLVIPAELRDRQHWAQGTPLLMIETAAGVVLATREQARDIVRSQLAGSDLVGELLRERRVAAAGEDNV